MSRLDAVLMLNMPWLKDTLINVFLALFIFVGEVSPYAATPCCARVCVYPHNGGPSPRNAPTKIVWRFLGDVLSNAKAVKVS
jgi:hypothetical protein